MIVKTVCYIQPPDSHRKATKHVERYGNLKLLVNNHLLRRWVSGKVGVSSHSQSHELQKFKWHPWSKDHVLNLVDKIIIMRLLSQEKKKGCFVPMRPLELDVHNPSLVFFLQINTKTSLINVYLPTFSEM